MPLTLIETVGKGVGAFVEVAVRLEEAALEQDLSGMVLDREVDPGLVHVTLFRHVRVGDAFVLNDDVGCEEFAGSDV